MEVNVLEKLNQIIENKGISQRRLAEKIGKSQGALNFILNGKTKLDLETFFKLCSALEVNPCDVLECTASNETLFTLGDYEYLRFLTLFQVYGEKRVLKPDYLDFIINFSLIVGDEAYQKLYNPKDFVAIIMADLAQSINNLTEEEKQKLQKSKILSAKLENINFLLNAIQNDDKVAISNFRRKFHQVLTREIAKRVPNYLNSVLSHFAETDEAKKMVKQFVKHQEKWLKKQSRKGI